MATEAAESRTRAGTSGGWRRTSRMCRPRKSSAAWRPRQNISQRKSPGTYIPGLCGAGVSLALRELERPAGALAAVLLAFLHAAVAGQVARITQLLGHVAFRRGSGWLAVGARRGGFGHTRRQPEHDLE